MQSDRFIVAHTKQANAAMTTQKYTANLFQHLKEQEREVHEEYIVTKHK